MGIKLEYSKILSKEIGVSHFFTTRNGGVGTGNYATFNLGAFCGDNPVAVSQNRKILCDYLQIKPEHLIIPREIHEDKIFMVKSDFFSYDEKEREKKLAFSDALITDIPGVCLAVTTADCVPILLYDKKNQVVAAVHAGWRGIVKEILPKTLRLMNEKYGSFPENIILITGPCINVKSYQINLDVVDEFRNVFSETDLFEILEIKKENLFYLNLKKAIYIQSIKNGIRKINVELHSGCTYHMKEHYFSARRDSIHSGRILSGIMLK